MAKDKADIWMPWYIGDYLADTMRLTTEQHGAYMLLLGEHWMKGPIPDDDEVLAAITRLPIDRWLKTRGLILGYFSVMDGFLVNKRATEEKAKAEAFKMKQKANGSKGGRPKQNNGEEKNPNITQMKPSSEPKQNPSESPSPSPSLIKDIPPDPQGGGGRRKVKTDETPYEQIRQSFETHLPMLPQPKPVDEWTDGRKSQVRARHTEKKGKADFWDRYFSYVAKSAFLTGNTPENFEATLDWLIKPGNMQKVREGNYHKVLNHG